MRVPQLVLSLSLPLTLIACSSSSPLAAPKSELVLGRQSNVRVQAEILTDSLSANSVVRVVCEVENLRQEPIEVAQVNGDSSFDPDTGVFTVNVGSEVPVDDPSQLVTLAPNQKHTFQVTAPLHNHRAIRPVVRVKLHFLQLPMSALAKLGSDFWDQWLEAKQTVVTNAIPVVSRDGSFTADAFSRPSLSR